MTTYHLEMLDRKAHRPASRRSGLEMRLVDPPDPALNCEFYGIVGAGWDWTDRLGWSEEQWAEHVERDLLVTFVGELAGKPVGYFELEVQEGGDVEILYFGLLPDQIGQGLGGALLSAAIECAWELPGTKRIWLHTCSADHRHALGNYQKRGFEVFKVEREPSEDV